MEGNTKPHVEAVDRDGAAVVLKSEEVFLLVSGGMDLRIWVDVSGHRGYVWEERKV